MGNITFQHVTFTYEDAKRRLSNAGLQIDDKKLQDLFNKCNIDQEPGSRYTEEVEVQEQVLAKGELHIFLNECYRMFKGTEQAKAFADFEKSVYNEEVTIQNMIEQMKQDNAARQAEDKPSMGL